MKRLYAQSLVITGALLLSAAAFAQDKDMAMEHQAKQTAMEHHQKTPMTAAEHDAYAKKRFEKMDANHDGFVTAAEMDQSRMAMHKDGKKMKHERSSAEVIKDMDSNGDGKLSEAEYRAGMKRMFDKLDTDKNGTLSPAEQDVAKKSMMMEHN
ncbi:EF-hand domain-containing protein [Stenotrophomonas sp. YIM B06876]|uniref:EF-hand domain-containing protein n=1 Tax=Stenotrophomonas sp. YIM B06876 TaxID=3060211 RepID=UPI002739E175|nr:EF-hand domain-containing protein [Stenotrophomonas sp. YIM B06876]